MRRFPLALFGLLVTLAASPLVALDCRDALPLGCGGAFGTGTRVTNSQQTYGCAPGQSFSGDELVADYVFDKEYWLTAYLTSAEPDQRLFLLEDCDPSRCVAMSRPWDLHGPAQGLEVGGLGAGRYTLVIDGEGPGSGFLSPMCDDCKVETGPSAAVLFMVKDSVLRPHLSWETGSVGPFHVMRSTEPDPQRGLRLVTTSVKGYTDRDCIASMERYFYHVAE